MILDFDARDRFGLFQWRWALTDCMRARKCLLRQQLSVSEIEEACKTFVCTLTIKEAIPANKAS